MPNLRLTDAQVADVATYLSTLKGGGGDAAKATPDAKAADDVLLDYLKNVMPFEDAKAQLAKLEPAAEAGRARAARDQPVRLLQLPRHQGLREGAVDRHRLVGRGQQARHAARLRVHHRHPAHVEDSRGSGPSCTIRASSTRAACCSRSRSCGCRTSTSPTTRFERLLDGDHELPARDSAAGGDAGAIGALRLPGRRAARSCTAATASAATSSKATAATSCKLVADPSLGPPMLTPEGARVQPDWLYAFLRGPITIRPWLNVRMPTFGLDDPNLNGVIRYFGAVSNTIGPFQTHEIVHGRQRRRDAGKQLFELLKCQQCHVLGAIPKDQPTSNLAPDLRMAPERLQSGLDPRLAEESGDDPARHAHAGVLARLSEVDVPTVRDSVMPDAFSGDAEAQIRAIRDHLLTFSGGPSPKPGGAKSANNDN